MKWWRLFQAAFVLCALCGAVAAEAEEAAEGLMEAKVADVAIFKGGSGIFAFEGEGTVADGALVLRDAPRAAFGTLWFYSLTDGVKVTGVSSKEVPVQRERPIADTWQLLRKNIGKEATVIMKDGQKTAEGVPQDWEVSGKIVAVSPDKQVFLSGENGVIACSVNDLRYAVIKDADTVEKTFTSRLEVHVALDGAEDGRKVKVGYSCLQEGINWLPAYRMDLADGKADIALSATVINNVFDIAGSRASFVVGRPIFTLARQLSPVVQANPNIDLSELVRQERANIYLGERVMLARIVEENKKAYAANQARFALEARAAGADERARRAVPQQPVATEAEEAWHLFYYTADDLTVAKNTSASVVLWVNENPVENLFVWDVSLPLPYQNPAYAERLRDIYAGGFFTSDTVEDKGSDPVRYEEARPPIHCLKLTNETGQPLASAPLLVYEDGRALGQVWMQYTPAGHDTQVAIGPTPDIRTKNALREVRREIGAREVGKTQYDLVTFEGSLKIENKRDEKASLQVNTTFEGTPLGQTAGAEVTTHRTSGMNPSTGIKWEIDVDAGKEKVLTFRYNIYVKH